MNETDLNEGLFRRFWEKVQKTESCWIWTGSKRYGYGTIGGRRGFRIGAHRLSWIIHKGPIPEGLHVLHNCPGGDNPSCVNPDHLWLGTNADNVADCVQKRRTHKGYKLTDDQVRQIHELAKTLKQIDLEKQFGVSNSVISQIVNGKLHTKLGLGSALRPEFANMRLQQRAERLKDPEYVRKMKLKISIKNHAQHLRRKALAAAEAAARGG